MKKLWKTTMSVLLSLALLAGFAGEVQAKNSSVTYDGKAREFIFAPGSSESPTDLFPDLKDVMPGDSVKQKLVIRNDESKKVKVKVYMRALGAQKGSEDFLSQLKLTVKQDGGGKLFEAPADEKAQLKDWVYLGKVYSGGEIDLTVKLDVPVTLGNEFQEAAGLLDWEFRVEEIPKAADDPKPSHSTGLHAPQTGDSANATRYIVLAGICIAGMAVIPAGKRRKKNEQ